MRVLVISDKSIFGKGLCALLAQQDNLEVIGPTGDVRQAEILAQIELLQPDVLVLDCPVSEADPLPALMRCLKDSLVQKIIVVDRQDNIMCIFTSQRQVVEEVSDLVGAITQTVSPSQPLRGV